MKSHLKLAEMPLNELTTIGEASRIAGVHRRTIYQWLEYEHIRGVQLFDGMWFIPRVDVEAWAASDRKPGAPRKVTVVTGDEDGQ